MDTQLTDQWPLNVRMTKSGSCKAFSASSSMSTKMRLRLKHYDVFLLPPPGAASEGSNGAVIRRKQLKAHVEVVFSLHETKTGIFEALDELFVFESKEHTAQGVLLSVTWPTDKDCELQDERKPKATIYSVTGKHPKRLFHSVDQLLPSDHGEHVVMSHNDRYELVEPFLRVFPKHVARCICQEAADLWFTEGALAMAAEMRLTTDLEGNWDGSWMTAADEEALAMLEGYASDLSGDSDDPPILPPDESTRPHIINSKISIIRVNCSQR